jgi:hypothetical protein
LGGKKKVLRFSNDFLCLGGRDGQDCQTKVLVAFYRQDRSDVWHPMKMYSISQLPPVVFCLLFFFSFFFFSFFFSLYGYLHLSTLHDRNILVRLISGSTCVFNHTNHVESINDLAEDNMFVVEKWSCGSCDKKLAAIGVWARVLLKSVYAMRVNNIRGENEE